jgi:hypothetical protein
MTLKIIHCCKAMEEEINDPRVFLGYASKYREYFIQTINPSIVRLIYICPWCGKTLPKSLRNEWFEALEKEYCLDDPWDKKQENLIPEEFKTDEWWKKRSL